MPFVNRTLSVTPPRLNLPAWIVCLCTGLAALPLTAERLQRVTLISGETVVGETLSISDADNLILQSAVLGRLFIDRAHVVSVEDVEIDPALVAVPTNNGLVQEPVAPATTQVANRAADGAPASAGGGAKEASETPLLRELWILEYQFPETWQGDLRFGMNFSSGDSRWREGFFRGKLEVQEAIGEFRLDGYYTYRETERRDGSTFKSINRYGGNGLYRYTFDDSNFFVQDLGSYRSDLRKGIFNEVQNTLGLGYGFDVFNGAEVIFGGGAGVRYSETEIAMNQGMGWITEVFQEFSWQPWQRATVAQNFRYYVDPQRSVDFNYILEAAIRYRMTNLLGFEFSYELDYDNEVSENGTEKEALWRNSVIVYF